MQLKSYVVTLQALIVGPFVGSTTVHVASQGAAGMGGICPCSGIGTVIAVAVKARSDAAVARIVFRMRSVPRGCGVGSFLMAFYFAGQAFDARDVHLAKSPPLDAFAASVSVLATPFHALWRRKRSAAVSHPQCTPLDRHDGLASIARRWGRQASVRTLKQ